MSKNKDYRPERNPLFTVLYIIAVVILAGALVFMVFTVKSKQKQQQDKIKKIASGETEYVITERMSETETESEPAKKASVKGKNTAAEKVQTETESETEDDKSLSILVLNGTRKPGVAAYWKEELEKDGYTNVYTASYSREVEDYTLLYSTDVTLKTEFDKYFPDCRMRLSKVEEGIEPDGDTQLPEDIDLYIVVGRNDCNNQ